MLRLKYTFCILLFVVFADVAAQKPTDSAYKIIAAGNYQRSSFHQKLWGRNRRVEWTTRVRVPLLYLDSAFGGLHPYQQGGGNETKSLRLRSSDGKEFALRSINKSREDVVLPEYKGTFI